MIRFAKSALWVAALGVLGAANLRADTLFNNLGQSAWGNIQVGSTAHRTGSDFLTDGSATTITGATVRLLNQDDVDHTVTVSLWSDSGSGTPGTLLGSFDPVSVPPSLFNNYSVSSAGIELAADSAYWLVLQTNENVNVGGIGWQMTSSHTADAGSVFSLIPDTEMQYSEDSGATWVDNFPYEFQFSLLPEPEKWASLGVGVLALGLLRRRKA